MDPREGPIGADEKARFNPLHHSMIENGERETGKKEHSEHRKHRDD